ncbi:uncharacterized protein LOC132305411 [Cornus florida]|uniref:uncharacterized protein LOC132305411 n=1 Tax=Cornus florida TaxID=4283 RepID=UPI00289D9D7A|nr:uncharacterized protein LOC132305411 [Cornus florida]
MSRLQIPSFGRKKNTPPATPTAGATSSPASASSSATISDTVPSTVAINPVASAPAASQSASPQATIAPAAAGGVRDKERGKRPHPDSEVDPEEEPLIRRTRVSGPGALLHRAIRAPAPSGPAAAGGSASASGPPSIPTLPPWAPRYTRTDGTFVKPNETMLKDGQTAMAYYRSMWTPKDLEAAKGLSQKDVFSRFPQSAMETLFGMMAMQKQVEMGNTGATEKKGQLQFRSYLSRATERERREWWQRKQKRPATSDKKLISSSSLSLRFVAGSPSIHCSSSLLLDSFCPSSLSLRFVAGSPSIHCSSSLLLDSFCPSSLSLRFVAGSPSIHC